MHFLPGRRKITGCGSIKRKIMEIENTYAEAFDGLYCRLLVTGERGLTKEDKEGPQIEYDPLRFAAYRATSTPAVVVGRTEAGIERWLPKEETPDKREGVILQFWGMYREDKGEVENFFKEVAIKIRQDILSVSGGTARIFNWLDKGLHEIDTKGRVGDCGGGYEEEGQEYGREYYSIPLMSGCDFKIDKKIAIGKGISGANLWFFCDSVEKGRKVGKVALEEIKKVGGVIAPFYLCPSGSMVKNYRKIGPPTNYPYCPTLRKKIPDGKVPEKVESIPEIVINGINLEAVKEAMRRAIKAVKNMEGLIKISAGNYEGKLGQHKIYLRELD